MSDPQPLFRTVNLTKIYSDGSVNALVNANLHILQGQFVAIMGPSGSGKSTLLNLLGALDRPSSGDVFFRGQPLSRMRDLDHFRARQLGFIFQSFYLLPTLTAAENVQVPMFEAGLWAAERARRAAELLELVGLSHRAGHLPRQLSVGERQRVAIARALANRPTVLLADEPTGNLDSQNAAQVLELFEELHRRQQLTIILVTHSSEVAERAERIIRLRDGRVIDDGTGRPTGS